MYPRQKNVVPSMTMDSRCSVSAADAGLAPGPRHRAVLLVSGCLGDARRYLLFTREAYDVIISEPSNPWIAGVGAEVAGPGT